VVSGGGVQWWTGTVFGGRPRRPSTTGAHAAGQLLLFTGDLAAYSAAHSAGSPPTFKELFPDGNRAEWVPLLVPLHDDGDGSAWTEHE